MALNFSKLVKHWKRLKGKNAKGKNFRKLLRRKQSSAKISKISGNTLKSSKSDIFYLLRNLLKYLLRTFFSSAKFSEVFTLCVFTLWLFPIGALKTLTSLNEESRPVFLGDNSIWRFPSVSSFSDYSIWTSITLRS